MKQDGLAVADRGFPKVSQPMTTVWSGQKASSAARQKVAWSDFAVKMLAVGSAKKASSAARQMVAWSDFAAMMQAVGSGLRSESYFVVQGAILFESAPTRPEHTAAFR